MNLAEVPALVLTAGLGTRLRPLTDTRAKAALPVAGTPMVGRILQWLAANGVRRTVLNLHHLPHTITRVVGDGAQFGLQVRYSWEPTLLGSAGGPRRALALLDTDRFFIINGDTLTDCDLASVLHAHESGRARITMAVAEGDVGRYGGVLADASGAVTGFGRVADPKTRAHHFIGVQVAEASAFSALDDGVPAESVKQVYPALLSTDPEAIRVFSSQAGFLDVGTARDYLETVAIVAAREARPYDVGADCRIAPDAVLTGAIVWDRVTIGAGARLTDCIVSEDVVVAAGAIFDRVVLTRVGQEMLASPF